MNLDKFKGLDYIVCKITHTKCLPWVDGDVKYIAGRKYKCLLQKIRFCDTLLVEVPGTDKRHGGPVEDKDTIIYFNTYFSPIDEYRKKIIEELL